MSTGQLEYWSPNGEERRLRIFISHRYGRDQSLYDSVLTALRSQGFSPQDISLTEDQKLKGPRGGRVADLKLQAEIAARIYSSDILITSSRPAIIRSEWIAWEVPLAAIGYGVPVLFVNHRGLQYQTRFVRETIELGLRSAVCEPETRAIVSKIADLVGTRPTLAVRRHEESSQYSFRGPPEAALKQVFSNFPYQARLLQSERADPPKKRPVWWRLAQRGGPAAG